MVGDDAWVRRDIEPSSDDMWPGRVWAVGQHLVSHSPGNPDIVAAERDRLEWLGRHLATVTVVVADDEWLVTTLPAGPSADRPDLHPVPDELPAALGRALKSLHELNTDDHPFSWRWSQRVADIERAISEDRLAVDRLVAPYDRYDGDQLLDLIQQGRPPDEDLVVGHGHPVVANFYLDARSLASFTGVHRLGLADRHQDLAMIHRSLLDSFGGEAVMGFYGGYGLEPDLLRLDHYLLVAAVDAAIVRPGELPGQREEQ